MVACPAVGVPWEWEGHAPLTLDARTQGLSQSKDEDQGRVILFAIARLSLLLPVLVVFFFVSLHQWISAVSCGWNMAVSNQVGETAET